MNYDAHCNLFKFPESYLKFVKFTWYIATTIQARIHLVSKDLSGNPEYISTSIPEMPEFSKTFNFLNFWMIAGNPMNAVFIIIGHHMKCSPHCMHRKT